MINEFLSEQFLDYCEDQQDLSANTILAYQQDLKAFCTFLGDAYRPDEAERETVLRYLRYLRKAKCLAPSTVQRRISTLRRCLHWRRQAVTGAPSPFDGLHLAFRKPRRSPRAIDAATLQLLFAKDFGRIRHGRSFSQEQITYLVLKLLIVTGLRIGELTGLNIKDVFSQDTKIWVMGKGSKERVVYVLNGELLVDFNRFMEWRRANAKLSDHLFPNRCGNRMTPPAFRKRLKLLSESRNITPHLTPHQFRHSAATMMIENDADIRIVQRLLGHASIATTEIYTHVTDLALQSAVARADILAWVIPEQRSAALVCAEGRKSVRSMAFHDHASDSHQPVARL